MKPNTRLLIRFTLPDGAVKSWGYDEPFYSTDQQLQSAIAADFKEWPENTEIRLFYYMHNEVITPANGDELAQMALDWLTQLDTYNGN